MAFGTYGIVELAKVLLWCLKQDRKVMMKGHTLSHKFNIAWSSNSCILKFGFDSFPSIGGRSWRPRWLSSCSFRLEENGLSDVGFPFRRQWIDGGFISDFDGDEMLIRRVDQKDKKQHRKWRKQKNF